ncbi:MAG TPA: LacI family DNA-binding transcriptional regulator [Chthoniobacteraceae bacterium]|jgi:DNA-binding LacI/PurR family transcriptional regulator|nr:LacI family DNA-binding transcriptional regulator [Chthoniobacteraceae bacterium]
MSDSTSIFSVAKRANCSIATVSNVINGKGRVGANTRKTVLKAVRELGYQPNSMGRSLRMRRTETLGLLFYPSCAQIFRNPFYAEVMEGLEETLLNTGYHLLLAGYEASVRSSEVPDFVQRGKVDGMILMGAFPGKIIHSFCELSTPLVLLDSNAEWPVDSVVSDGFSAEVKIVSHLVENGHKEIVMLAYNMEDYNIDLRIKGFLAGLEKNGLRANASSVIHHALAHEEIYTCLKARLNSPNPPTAIVTVNDTLAIVTEEWLKKDGFRVPDQISIVGYDDDPFSANANPPLSTVRVNKKKLGEAGADLVLKRIETPDRPIAKLALPTELVIRKSVRNLAAR